LLAPVVAVTAVLLEEPLTAVRERHDPVANIDRDVPDQVLLSQVRHAVVARVRQIALGHDAKRTDRAERPHVVAVERVLVAADQDELAFMPLRQVEVG
jgi:hypothetical protein